MSKQKTLNITERLICIGFLNQHKGTLQQLAFVSEDLRHLSLTEDEREKSKFTVAEGGQTSWNNYEGSEKEFELSDESVAHIVKTIKDRDAKGEFSLQDSLWPFYQPLLDKLA